MKALDIFSTMLLLIGAIELPDQIALLRLKHDLAGKKDTWFHDKHHFLRLHLSLL